MTEKLRVVKTNIKCNDCFNPAEFQIYDGAMLIGSFCEYHKNKFMEEVT